MFLPPGQNGIKLGLALTYMCGSFMNANFYDTFLITCHNACEHARFCLFLNITFNLPTDHYSH